MWRSGSKKNLHCARTSRMILQGARITEAKDVKALATSYRLAVGAVDGIHLADKWVSGNSLPDTLCAVCLHLLLGLLHLHLLLIRRVVHTWRSDRPLTPGDCTSSSSSSWWWWWDDMGDAGVVARLCFE